MASKFLNLSTDDTLGGVSPSDDKAVSEKAIKNYIDNNSFSGSYNDLTDKPTNLVTTNTTQIVTGQKTFKRTESQFQDSVARFVSTYNSSTDGWRGRVVIGAKDYTFIIGTYNGMAAIGGHLFEDSSTESNATWSDIYFQPDGDKAVYFGGWSWTQNSGWLKVQNNASNTGGKVQVNTGTISSANWKDVAYKGENISDFNNDSGFITSSALSGYATETWVGNQGYITGITSSDVTTALGYTPYNSNNPDGYVTATYDSTNKMLVLG